MELEILAASIPKAACSMQVADISAEFLRPLVEVSFSNISLSAGSQYQWNTQNTNNQTWPD